MIEVSILINTVGFSGEPIMTTFGFLSDIFFECFEGADGCRRAGLVGEKEVLVGRMMH